MSTEDAYRRNPAYDDDDDGDGGTTAVPAPRLQAVPSPLALVELSRRVNLRQSKMMVIQAVERLLCADRQVFQLGGQLVAVRPDGEIITLNAAKLRDAINRACVLGHYADPKERT